MKTKPERIVGSSCTCPSTIVSCEDNERILKHPLLFQEIGDVTDTLVCMLVQFQAIYATNLVNSLHHSTEDGAVALRNG